MIKYQVICRKNPVNSDVKFYAQVASPEPITLDRICDSISHATTVTSSDVKAVVDALEHELLVNLQEGRSIRFGQIGSFRVTLHSIGTVEEKAFTTGNIHRTSVQFRASNTLRYAVDPSNPKVRLVHIPNPPIPAQPPLETVTASEENPENV